MRLYNFGSMPGCPPELKGSNWIATDGVGAYYTRDLSSWQWGSVKLNGTTAVAVVEGAGIDGAVPIGTGFALAFQELTGGCVYDSTKRAGLAAWRQAAESGGGPVGSFASAAHTHDGGQTGAAVEPDTAG